MRIVQFLFLFIGIAWLAPSTSYPREVPSMYRIGFLSANTQSQAEIYLDALRNGLRDIGYEEGKNIQFEQRYAEGVAGQLPRLAEELIRADVSLLVTASIPAALAAKKTTTTIPIIVAAAGDFVGNGLVSSLTHPGGNITGIDEVVPGLTAKRLEFFNDAVRANSRVAILSSATGPTHAKQMEESE